MLNSDDNLDHPDRAQRQALAQGEDSQQDVINRRLPAFERRLHQVFFVIFSNLRSEMSAADDRDEDDQTQNPGDGAHDQPGLHVGPPTGERRLNEVIRMSVITYHPV